MKSNAYAKVNLALDVVAKREDGYHDLAMIMQTIDLYDEMEVTLREAGIRLTCDKVYLPADRRNIAYRAAEAFFEKTGIQAGADIRLKKNIPVAAGLAGGSTNAATVLELLNHMTDQPLSRRELLNLGLSLGADVPFCLTGGTARCEGVGEIITPIDSPVDFWLLLVKPSFGLSTKQIFGAFDLSRVHRHPDLAAVETALIHQNLPALGNSLGNVLENVSFRKRPILRKIKRQLLDLGAHGSLMSGSGPTIFGLFANQFEGQQAYRKMKALYREVFLVKALSQKERH